jgi:thioredoxin reductase (NADPH)
MRTESSDTTPSAADPSARSEPAAPVLLVIDGDDEAREVSAAALERRFAPDFRVLTASSGRTGVDMIAKLLEGGEDVALVAADLRLPDANGVEVLEQAHAVCRSAARVLLVDMDENHTRIPFTVLPTIQRATALGAIDFFVVKGWVTPEEWLYPQVQDVLTAWTTSHRPSHAVYRIVGEKWAPRSHELRDLLTRNGVPFMFHPVDSPTGAALVHEYGVDVARLPAAIRDDGSVLQNPTLTEVAEAHGVHTKPLSARYDLIVVGAGPAGLAAAMYGASEGLQTLTIERAAIGGQAGQSSMIRNYLGFPRGIGGGELAHRAWEQATLFGADFVFTHRATRLVSRGDERVVVLDDGGEVASRAVIVAVGVSYRLLDIPSLDRLVGAGVFYGAAAVEAPAMAGEQVYVVGGANSAGQAALHLARYAAGVTLVVRGESLAAGMSDYLVRQVEATPNLHVRLRTRIVDGRGETRLAGLTLEHTATGQREDVEAAAVFVLIGAEPRTEWLADTLRVDDRGFIPTGRDVPSDAWPLGRPPFPFETSLPGVFAAGDVRLGSVKRVAGAAGEGSVSVGSVHQYLSEAGLER